MIKLMIEVSEAAELKKDVLDLAELLGYKVPATKAEIEVKEPTAPKKVEEPKAETTEEVEAEEAPVKEAPEESDDDLSLEDLREKVAAFAKADPENKKAVKALLDEKGYKAVSDIPGAERQAFLDELEIE